MTTCGIATVYRMATRRTAEEPATVAFAHVRVAALAELDKGAFTAAGQWRPCVWQGYRDASHVGPYCNTLSHLEALHDLLEHGTWCDPIVLGPWLDDSGDAEWVFRYYGLVFLAWHDHVQDLRLIQGVARPGKAKSAKVSSVDELMGLVNHVYRHRGTPDGDQSFHERHHHGPYLFADVPGHEAVLPADRRYVAVGHRPPVGAVPPVPLVVPSLVGVMRRTSQALRSTSSILRQADARNRVSDAYSLHRW